MSRRSMTNPPQRIELTERQEDVVRLMAKGLTNPEIAERLGISLDGAKWHVSEILTRLGASSREDAVRRWREQRSSGRRLRHWAGAAWGSMALRWTGAAVLAGGAGLTGIAAFAGVFATDEPPVEEPPAASVAHSSPTVPSDTATVHGLTLSVQSVRADDVQTVIEVSLEGRPELGRLLQMRVMGTATGAIPTEAIDDAGAKYQVRSAIPNEARVARFVFGPVSPNTRWLDLVVPAATFVPPEIEGTPGPFQLDPSATIEGPWVVRITDIPRDPTVFLDLSLEPLPFGDGTAIPFQIIHRKDSTVLGVRFEGVTVGRLGGLHAFPELTYPNGDRVPMPGTRVGTPPSNETTQWVAYEPTHGEVHLQLRPVILGLGPIAQQCLTTPANCPRPEDVARRDAENAVRKAELEATLAGQQHPTWTFTIP